MLVIGVHLQDTNRRASDSCPTNDRDAIPGKVRLPLLLSWMKQLGEFVRLGINACQIWTFMQITVDTG